MLSKTGNAILNLIWGLGYIAMGDKILGIGLLAALPFLHWPPLVGRWALYVTYPGILVLIGLVILTAVFVVDAYVRTED